MDRVLTGDVWKQVAELIGSRRNLMAAIAYVSRATALSFKKGDLLLCDASDSAIAAGETDVGTLRRYNHAGAELYNCPNLHAKMLVAGRIAVLGSANLSRSSKDVLIEASLISDRASIRSQLLALIGSFLKIAKPINAAALSRMENIPVNKPSSPRKRRPPSVANPGNRYWITAVFPIGVPPSEQPYVERGEKAAKKKANDPDAKISWIRFAGRPRLRQAARKGDTIVQISHDDRRVRVYEPLAILHRQDVKRWTRFYVEEPADTFFYMTWNQFNSAVKSVGIRRIKQTSVRELSPHEILLMESIWERVRSKGSNKRTVKGAHFLFSKRNRHRNLS